MLYYDNIRQRRCGGLPADKKKNPDLPAGTQKTNKRHYSEMKSLSKIFSAMRYARSSGRLKIFV